MNNIFDEIDKVKKDLPKIKSLQKEVTGKTFNFYQIVAIIIYAILFCLGIILGNLFPACTTTGLYNALCTQTQFNLSLTVFIWGISFLGCVLFYGLGHIIALLTSINEHLSKK